MPFSGVVKFLSILLVEQAEAFRSIETHKNSRKFISLSCVIGVIAANVST